MSNDRGVTLGGGPMQPPAPSDVAKLTEENERLRRRLREVLARQEVNTPDDLSQLLNYVFGTSEVFVDTDLDGELTVRIPDLTITDGEIAPARREFEVSTEITFEVTATVEAADEDAARDLFTEALDDALLGMDVKLDGHLDIESSYTTQPDIGYLNVAQF